MNNILALILFIAIGGLAGCNTMAGAGRDIQSSGQAVSHAATHVQRKL
ncbi:entericidin A/B family lipoprotein [uncultured Thiodictyon sp.]|nr:entericidin A/B family lipoprotein [uncultured Thiodictyon sp.]